MVLDTVGETPKNAVERLLPNDGNDGDFRTVAFADKSLASDRPASVANTR
jgi:hypothetical protein